MSGRSLILLCVVQSARAAAQLLARAHLDAGPTPDVLGEARTLWCATLALGGAREARPC